MDKLLKDDLIVFGKDEIKVPQFKRYLQTMKTDLMKSHIVNNENGEVVVRDLFESTSSYFEHPKPVTLLKYIFNGTQFEEGPIIVLDFFAGSGTTAHAVLISEKDKQLSFVCVQIPELIGKSHIAYSKGYKKISDLSKSRIKKVIQKSKFQNSFKVLKLDNSNLYKWEDADPSKGIVDLATQLELSFKNPLKDGVQATEFITEILLQEGFPLTATQEEVVSGIFKITHEWVPYTLYATMLSNFKDSDLSKLPLQETDHFICLDKAFGGNDSLKQNLDNRCQLYTI